MTPEERAAYIMAQAAACNAEVAGMTAENLVRVSQDKAPAYGEDAFNAVIEKYGVHHNAVIAFFGR